MSKAVATWELTQEMVSELDGSTTLALIDDINEAVMKICFEYGIGEDL